MALAAAAAPLSYPLPKPHAIFFRLLRVWFVGVIVFGCGLSMGYGWFAWLLNDQQRMWASWMFFVVAPLLWMVGVVVLPAFWYRPIHQLLNQWQRHLEVSRSEGIATYERALLLPWWIAVSAFIAATVSYLIGILVVRWQADLPLIEMGKTLPAIPLVGGMMGAFCYFGTVRVLHPVVMRCSVELRHARPIRRTSLGTKFLTTTWVLTLAALCLLEPTAYTLGQITTERYLSERALIQLQAAVRRASRSQQTEELFLLLHEAKLGDHGYVFAVDTEGRVVTPHPLGYTRLAQEGIAELNKQFGGLHDVWVDRVGRHRVIAIVRSATPPWTVVSVSFPSDFDMPLRRFVQFCWIVALELLFLAVLFGRYYTRGITTPLAELTKAARQITEYDDLSQHVPVTTNDELGELARAFNRMVERIQTSKGDLEEYTKRLERSTQELTALNQEMEDLLRVVSHDLRAPLINIQGFSKRLEPVLNETVRTLDQVIAAQPANGLRQQAESLKASVQTQRTESLQFIWKSVEKMDALLTSLLAVSRVGRKADPLQPHDLDGILDDVLATFSHQLTEASIQVIRHPMPQGVPCRRNEMNQVFSNLISNAINYMGPTGDRFIEIGGIQYEDRAECYVRDTGIGIDPEDHERVFQMFTRLHAIEAPGEGVGLAYTKKILRGHGGRLWLVSQRGQGSTFFFTLPLQPVAGTV